MFRKVLIAVQDAVSDRAVFEEGLAIAKTNQASLLLLHIVPLEAQTTLFPPTLLGYGTPVLVETTIEHFRSDWQALENQGLSLLQALGQEAHVAGVACDFIQLVGNPATTICDISRDWGIDLIVMGRRGYSGLSEWISGSVSNYTLHHAPCSVLVVQNLHKTEEAASSAAKPATLPSPHP
jgi:nucleotide-binding universal stress UspA family protein